MLSAVDCLLTRKFSVEHWKRQSRSKVFVCVAVDLVWIRIGAFCFAKLTFGKKKKKKHEQKNSFVVCPLGVLMKQPFCVELQRSRSRVKVSCDVWQFFSPLPFPVWGWECVWSQCRCSYWKVWKERKGSKCRCAFVFGGLVTLGFTLWMTRLWCFPLSDTSVTRNTSPKCLTASMISR